MKVLITGAAGFIGSNLSEFHLKRNDIVYGIDNFITGSSENVVPLVKNKHFHFYEEDILNFPASPAGGQFSVFNFPFNIIYHLASPASPVQYMRYPVATLRVNSEGTYKLLEFMRHTKSEAFVLASSSEVYGDPEIHPQVESYWGHVNPNGIRSCYDEGKRFAESVAMTFFRKYNLDVRIARIFNTYGPNMEKEDGRVVSNFVIQALTHKPITVYGDGNQTRSFCYVSDMVNGLYELATKRNIAGTVLNLGNPDEYTVSDFARIIQQITKTSSPIINKPIGADDPRKRKPDISKAKKLLGWKPKVTLTEGLNKTISYFKKRFL